MKNVYIVRHCKAEGQAANAQLTDLGFQQAKELAEFLSDKNIDYMISSPYDRTIQTITPLADKLGIKIVVDDRLTERVLSAKNHPEWREMLRKTFEDLDLCYDGGESSNAATNRVVAAVTDVLKGGYKNAVIVTHGNLMSLLLKYFDNRIGFAEWEALSNPDVYRLSLANDTPAIKRIWAE